MATTKKTGAAGAAAALPLSFASYVDRRLTFTPRVPVGDESAVTVAAEYLAELVDALKVPEKLTDWQVSELVGSAERAALAGGHVAHWFTFKFCEFSLALIRTSGNPAWVHAMAEDSKRADAWVAEREAKQRAERVARMAAGRKAAAERRAVAALSLFPRQSEAHA